MRRIILVGTIGSLLFITACNKAQMYYSKGTKKFDQGEYQLSLENYKQYIGEVADAKKQDKQQMAEAYHRIAESYRLSNRPQEAAEYYEKAIENGSRHAEDDRFWLAYSKKTLGQYENAKKLFEDYLDVGTDFSKIDHAKKHIDNIGRIDDINEKLDRFKIEYMEAINTDQNEYAPVPFKDKVYFTSSRGEGKMYNADGTRFTDLYEFKRDGSGGNSGVVKKLPETINVEDAHDATAIILDNGNTIIFSRSNVGSRKEASHEVNIYITRFENGAWTEAELLPISKLDAWDSSPFLSNDGSTIYFSSNRDHPDAQGGTDLYKSVRSEAGTWGPVENLGPKINTPGNEMFPYMDEEDNLYFSSDAHPGYGALDLFVAEKTETGDIVIENLGRTINSTFDDFSLYFRDDTSGYYCSNRPKNDGDDMYDDDIYLFTYYTDLIVEYKLDGIVFTKDEKTGDTTILANSAVALLTAQGDTLAQTITNDKGAFEVAIEPEKKYELAGKHTGYLTNRIDYSTEGATLTEDKAKNIKNVVVLHAAIELKPKKKITLKIKNLLYDFDKWDIRPDASKRLDKVVEFLHDNPGIKVELGSHTDFRGSSDYNRRLAQKRAESAVAYIVNHGIPKENIVAKGYGEDEPYTVTLDDVREDSVSFEVGTVLTQAFINGLSTEALKEEAHQLNRRTELKIIGIKKEEGEIILDDQGKAIKNEEAPEEGEEEAE